MRIAWALALLIVTGGTSAAGETIEVRVSGEEVAIHAILAPVSNVLDELSRRAGIKVVYDGTPPQDPVTMDRVSRSPAEAILSLLEGLGLSYILQTDPTGTRVETLIIASRTSLAASAPASPAATGAEQRRRMIEESRAMQEERDEDLLEDFAVGFDGDPDAPPADSFAGAVEAAEAAVEAEAERPPGASPVPMFPGSPFAPNPLAPTPGVVNPFAPQRPRPEPNP